MIIKQVKEYGTKSKRQRIELKKTDGLESGIDVVIFPQTEYNKMENSILYLEAEYSNLENEMNTLKENNKILKKQIQTYENQEQNLKEIIKNAVTPIENHYQKEIQNKDDKIKELEIQLKSLERKTNQYNLDMQGLNTIDIAIFRKHKKLIQNFNEEITLLLDDPQIVNTNAKKLPGKDVDHNK